MDEERKICVVIGSVPVERDAFRNLDRAVSYIVCADGGYDNAVRCGIIPDLLLGDFDSVQTGLPENVETLRLKVEKDDTDTFAAVKECIRRGYRCFELYGVLGGARMDHSYASLCVVQYLTSQGCRAVVMDGSRRVFLLNGGRLTLSGMKGRTVSVFPFGCASCEVSYKGMKYPLEAAVLESEIPLGASNLIVEDTAQITVQSGNAIVFVER